MPALLFLLHRRRAGLDLFARPDLVSVPPAVLLQRAQLAGPPTHRRRDRLHACRQRFCAHRRLAAGADLGRSASPAALHQVLDRYAQQCCPVFDVLAPSYHWSLMQVEYATDLVFRSQAVLKPLYEQLSRQAILTVKAEHVATFLGHKITPQLAQEIGSQFATRIEGTCVKHRFGKSSIKIYDKFGLVLRSETTTNDVYAFKHYRKVEHQHGPATYGLAPLKKNIYSLNDLREILRGCNRRYLEYLSSLDDFSAGIRALDRLTQPRAINGRRVRGLNSEPTRRPAASRLQHRRPPPRRPPANAWPVCSRYPHPAARSPAPPRRHQTRHRHLSLLSYSRRPCRHRCRPAPQRTPYC